MELAARAGYDPRAGVTLWQKMAAAPTRARRRSSCPRTRRGATRIHDIEANLPKVEALYAARRSRRSASGRRHRRRPAALPNLEGLTTRACGGRAMAARAWLLPERLIHQIGMTTRQHPISMTQPIDDDAAWPELQRARRAIVVVDVVESVRLMQADEAGVIDRWRRFVNLVRTQLLPAHGGRMVKSLGDGLLLEFATVPPAAQAAIDMQSAIDRQNQGRPDGECMKLRIGVHLAEVTSDEHDIYGTGVNLAAV